MASPGSQLSRRRFAAGLAGGAFAAVPPRPNILWITCEDTGPHLRACGDKYSVTPNLDALAARGVLYRNAWSNAPVCAPARTTIISGMYPTSTGSEHMRSITRLPEGMKLFPAYLRAAGYYCSNNVKEDYNLEKTPDVWDDSSSKAHWRNRAPSQPFFSVFNYTITHESQIRRRPHTLVHDPARVRVPGYMPDTPEVRHDWAQYYDNITTMDGQAGGLLKDLHADGLAEDTIVIFFGDHGPGMPRSKRWPYDSGLHVCIVAHIPEKFRRLAPKEYSPGGATDRLVGFVDLAPTMLSLAGIAPRPFHQGHAFMGPYQAPARTHLFGFRGRMDERYDLVRTVRNRRYVYVRNYMPHKIYGQHLAYMFEMPTVQVWKKLYDEGKLKPPQTAFWETKPPEELYDLEKDPDETRNLAASPMVRPVLDELRDAHRKHTARIRDVGLLPEGEIHERARGDAPYAMGQDPKRYDLPRIHETAEKAAALDARTAPELARLLGDADSGVRYWAALGLLMRGEKAVRTYAPSLRKALSDGSPYVRIVAAEALGRYGTEEDLRAVLPLLVDLGNAVRHGAYTAMAALNALDALGRKAMPVRGEIAALPRSDPKAPERVRTEYVTRLLEHLEATLRETA